MGSLSSSIRTYLRRTSRLRGIQSIADLVLATSLGRVRTENQDRVIHVTGHLGSYLGGGCSLTVLCDGMGGMAGGSIAAEIACSVFIESFIKSDILGLDRRLTKSMLDADKAVYNELRGKGGATLVALVQTEKAAWVVSVGDSRLYAFQRHSGLQQVTHDDTLSEMLKRSGSPDHIVERGDQLVQFVGLGEGIEPHLYVLDASAPDLIMLTSDGAHCIGNELLEKICRANSENVKLVESILAVAGALGGIDNASIVAIPFRSEKDEPEEAGITRVFTPHSGAELTILTAGATPNVQQPRQPNVGEGQISEAQKAPAVEDKVATPMQDRARIVDVVADIQTTTKKSRKKKEKAGKAREKNPDVLTFDFPKDGR